MELLSSFWKELHSHRVKCCSDTLKMRVSPAHLTSLTLGSPLSTGQSFYSRVLENCEDVADFDEVGCLSPRPHPSPASIPSTLDVLVLTLGGLCVVPHL